MAPGEYVSNFLGPPSQGANVFRTFVTALTRSNGAEQEDSVLGGGATFEVPAGVVGRSGCMCRAVLVEHRQWMLMQGCPCWRTGSGCICRAVLVGEQAVGAYAELSLWSTGGG